MPATQITTTVPTSIKRAPEADTETVKFLKETKLVLGGDKPFFEERRHHHKILWVKSEGEYAKVRVEPLLIEGPHGLIPVRCYHPSDEVKNVGALIYIHGGGWTVGSLDEFDSAFRIFAARSGCQVYGVDYHLAPEWKFPTQLEEVEAVLHWLHSNAASRNVDNTRIGIGGDSAGGNMTAVICRRLRDGGEGSLVALQLLLYPETKVPFDTPSGSENCTGYYLQTRGVLSFAWNMLPEGQDHSVPDITPMNASDKTKLPPAHVVTNGYDPLRDVGHQYALALQQAGNQVSYVHCEDMTHGFIQFTKWSKRAMEETLSIADVLREKLGGGK